MANNFDSIRNQIRDLMNDVRLVNTFDNTRKPPGWRATTSSAARQGGPGRADVASYSWASR